MQVPTAHEIHVEDIEELILLWRCLHRVCETHWAEYAKLTNDASAIKYGAIQNRKWHLQFSRHAWVDETAQEFVHLPLHAFLGVVG